MAGGRHAEDLVATALTAVREAHDRLAPEVHDVEVADEAIRRLLERRADEPLGRLAMDHVILHRTDRYRELHPEPVRDPVAEGWAALDAGDEAAATALAEEALSTPASPERAIFAVGHHAHVLLGTIARRRGDLADAARHLAASLDEEPSPAMRSFGPDLSLAFSLLGTDEEPAAVAYLRRCAAFWQPRHR